MPSFATLVSTVPGTVAASQLWGWKVADEIAAPAAETLAASCNCQPELSSTGAGSETCACIDIVPRKETANAATSRAGNFLCADMIPRFTAVKSKLSRDQVGTKRRDGDSANFSIKVIS